MQDSNELEGGANVSEAPYKGVIHLEVFEWGQDLSDHLKVMAWSVDSEFNLLQSRQILSRHAQVVTKEFLVQLDGILDFLVFYDFLEFLLEVRE